MSENSKRRHDEMREIEFLADTLDEVLDRLSFIADEANRQTKAKIRQLIGDVQEKLARGPGEHPVVFAAPDATPE